MAKLSEGTLFRMSVPVQRPRRAYQNSLGVHPQGTAFRYTVGVQPSGRGYLISARVQGSGTPFRYTVTEQCSPSASRALVKVAGPWMGSVGLPMAVPLGPMLSSRSNQAPEVDTGALGNTADALTPSLLVAFLKSAGLDEIGLLGLLGS